jgi:hypothetical protein
MLQSQQDKSLTEMLSRFAVASLLFLFILALLAAPTHSREPKGKRTAANARSTRFGGSSSSSFVVMGYNDLGMHCMNQDFSQLCILPPFNNLHAQVIERRGEEPRIVGNGVSVRYSIPGNTVSANKTNFWMYAPALFGVNLPLNIGLTGNGMAGFMQPTGNNDWHVTGIPITPLDDGFNLNPYPLSRIDVVKDGRQVASTAAVVPVSWEISCNICHGTGGNNVDQDILMKHDALHNTRLMDSRPVLCAKCHADPALGTGGVPGVKPLSHAMHGSHAEHVSALPKMVNKCYACHPGFQTNCQRDVHLARGIQCTDCHGGMVAVANPSRRPWTDQPTCGSCHQSRRPDFEFEQPGTLFKDSKGHHGVHCAACHGSPHAITPTVTAADNVQAIQLQGFPGVIRKCTVCHTEMPDDKFEHRYEGEDDEDEKDAEDSEDKEDEKDRQRDGDEEDDEDDDDD